MSKRLDILQEIESRLGYEFANQQLLDLALTHTSWANEHGCESYHNERLEFLGDAVLELCVSHILYQHFPDAREGELTELRSRLVSEPALAALAKQLNLAAGLQLGRGEDSQGGRERNAILADAFEATLAAIYLDQGYPAASRAIETLFRPLLPCLPKGSRPKDAKSRLQEYCQKHFKALPAYTVLETSGPEHAQLFKIEVALPNGRKFQAVDLGSKKASHAAAKAALAALGQ